MNPQRSTSTQNTWTTVLTIAAWEFRRFVKLRDMLLSLLIMGLAMGAGYGVSTWQQSSAAPPKLAILSDIPIELDETFDAAVHRPEDRPQLQQQLTEGQLDGILAVEDEAAVLEVDKAPAWHGALELQVGAAIQHHRLGRLPVPAEQLALALATVPVQIEARDDDDGGSTRLLGIAIGGLMVVSLMMGMSYLFVSITGDKQQRVTEQLFGIVPAQTLVDGKLLGVAAVGAFVTTQMLGITGALMLALKWSARAKIWDFITAVSPSTAMLLLLFAALGFALWFALWGALFATIDDPHSSQRSSLLMLPLLPLSLAFMGLESPGSVAMQILSLVPLTSMSVMPVRLVLASVPAWQLVASLALLFGSVVLARRFAGRLYEAAILHHGKEPGLSQMLAWARPRS